MAESLFSQSWYRVAQMRPRLRLHTHLERHTYRGRDWFVLQDHSTGRLHRFSPEAYQILGLMDGRRSLDEIWNIACARLGDDMPTQDEVIQLIAQLHRIDALMSDLPPDFEELQRRHDQLSNKRLLTILQSPLSVTVPLVDPDRFLERTMWLVRPMFTWVGLLVWLAVVGPALFLALVHWRDLTSNFVDRAVSMENLVALTLAYPLFKLLHEFGHAYAVKNWGGEVHEMGVMLLVLFPVPYVNASAASGFRQAHRRAIVSAAGIFVETFLAGLAMFAWLNLEPGRMHALAYAVMLTAGVSTIVFNGNPLLRFDAHYILADLLEIPNLGKVANKYLTYLAERYLLGIPDLESPAEDGKEAFWLATYGAASLVYRLVVMVSVALFMASHFGFVGVGFASWSVAMVVVYPVWTVLKMLFDDGRLEGRRTRAIAVALALTALPLGIVFATPIPSFTTAEGVIAADEKAQVYANVPGFVEAVVAEPGTTVTTGTPLVTMKNPSLDLKVRLLRASQHEMEVRERASQLVNRTEAQILKDEVARVANELADAESQQRTLTITAPSSGRFLLPSAEDLPGRYLARGALVGYVVSPDSVDVKVVVGQGDIDMVRRSTLAVEARLASAPLTVHACRIKRHVPAATKELPSFVLTLQGGGELAVDPRVNEEPRALENVFLFDVDLPNVPLDRIGGRVHVRFVHPRETLAARGYRALRRMLLSRFEV